MKAIRGLAAVILVLSAICLLVAVALNFANIIGRYVFFSPIASAEEIMLFLFVGTVFLGNSVVGWRGQQLRMDVLLHALPPRWRRALDIFADLAVIVVSLILIVNIPLVIPQALVPIGLGLNALLVGARLVAGIRPEQPPGAPPVEAF